MRMSFHRWVRRRNRLGRDSRTSRGRSGTSPVGGIKERIGEEVVVVKVEEAAQIVDEVVMVNREGVVEVAALVALGEVGVVAAMHTDHLMIKEERTTRSTSVGMERMTEA